MKLHQSFVSFVLPLSLATIVFSACGGGGVFGPGSGAGPNSVAERSSAAGSLDALTSSAGRTLTFRLTVSPGARACLPHAAGIGVLSDPSPQVQELHISVSGLPPNADFDAFIIQVPNKPFGLAWYQGDIDTNSTGNGSVNFLGRFSIETFIVAPGVAPAPDVFRSPPFPDATSNPKTSPVQLYHVGVWFNSPSVAARAGCANTVTPFNGTHNAGIQVLNTGTFPITAGPLRGFN